MNECHDSDKKESIKKNRAEYMRQYYIKNKERCDESLAKYRSNNPHKVLESGRKSREKNRDKNRKRYAKYYAENTEKCNIASMKWMRDNPDALRVHENNRRARTVTGDLSKDIVEKLFKLQRGKCACCKKPLGKDFHIDHINPLALGGTNTDDNVQLLLKRCNLTKSWKDPIRFMQEKGFLL